VINAKRVQVEAAKRRWLFRHRDLFQPLLPSTHYFDMLRKEVSEIGEKVTYVPFHALTEQPALIQGGEMKDYQVRVVVWVVAAWAAELQFMFSCKGWLFLCTCITMVSLRAV
jgi:SWI/SNF-related matrix-associated actin-dependent regulator of chromatin subfamily A member 5